MKPKNLIVLFLMSCLVLMIGEGCTRVAQNVKSEYELTDRQIRILEEEGLPTSFDALTAAQKRAVAAIEEMLLATEEKYGKSFDYVGYVPAGVAEEEHLIAVPVSGDRDLDRFSVYRTVTDGKSAFRDTYAHVQVRNLLADLFFGYALDNWGENAVKAYFAVTDLRTEDAVSEASVRGQADAVVWCFFDASLVSEDVFRDGLAKIAEWGTQTGVSLRGETYLEEHDAFIRITAHNYTDYMAPEQVALHLPLENAR